MCAKGNTFAIDLNLSIGTDLTLLQGYPIGSMLLVVTRSYGKGSTTQNGCDLVPAGSQMLDVQHSQPRQTTRPKSQHGLTMVTWHRRPKPIGKDNTGFGIIGPEDYAGLLRSNFLSRHVLQPWSDFVLGLSSRQTRHTGSGLGLQETQHLVWQEFH
jgi:hypothetical protein